jgi:hypothetical protein
MHTFCRKCASTGLFLLRPTHCSQITRLQVTVQRVSELVAVIRRRELTLERLVPSIQYVVAMYATQAAPV